MKSNVPKRTEIWVGIFVILSTVVLFLMVIFMAGEQKLFAEKFEVRAVFGDVQGLRVGGPVLLSGLNCGTVKSIQFTAGGQLVVVMLIRNEFREHIREDSVASIGTIGLLGDKSVDITAGSVGYEMIKEGGVLQTLPSLTFAEVLNRSRPMFDALGETFANLQVITDRLGQTQQDLGEAMAEFKKLTASINRGEGSLGRFVSEDTAYRTILHAIEQIKRFAERMNSPAGSVGRLIQDPKLYDETMQAVRNIGQAAETIQKLARGAMPVVEEAREVIGGGKQATSSIKNILRRIDLVAQDLTKASARLPDMMAETRQLLEDARGTVQEAHDVVKAAKDHWIIRSFVSEPEPVVVIHEPR